jgi:26S proteasome regulatory subunit N5
MYEKSGDISKSAEVLQEVHVETYGSLSKREKLDFILEQVRMVLLKRDFVRAYIVSQKVNKKLLEEPAFKDAKVAFYTLMIDYYREMKDAWELSNCYMQIYSAGLPANSGQDGPGGVVAMDDGQEDVGGGAENLQAAVAFLCLSKHGPEQVDKMLKLLSDETCASSEVLVGALRVFTTHEIVKCPFPGMSELLSCPACQEGGKKETWNLAMSSRTTEHNVRTAARYYKRITGSRLCGLLGMSGPDLERAIANMVAEGEVEAKIDRPRDVVRFGGKTTDESVLTEWAADLGELLGVVEKTWEGVQKEMVA